MADSKLKQLVLNVGWDALMMLASGDMIQATTKLSDGSEIFVSVVPVDGGIPVDITYLDKIQERYIQLADAMQKARDKKVKKGKD